MYKKNPRSKVFAPLAESFRRLGMLEDALKVLKDGIRYNPDYALGYIVLANCYFDQEKYDLTYNTLRPIISRNVDNISLQKTFAQACINLGYLEEALDTYKYLLFMNPRDKFFADQVKKLEDDLLVGHKKLSLEQIIKAPNLPEYIPEPSNDEDWVQVNFGRTTSHSALTHTETPKLVSSTDAEDGWVMKKPENFSLEEHPILKKESITKRDLEDDFFADEFEEEHGDIEEVNAESISSDAPIVSHTLIDLYCAQHYYDKALELLQKIIELNPNDHRSIAKMTQVMMMKTQHQGHSHPEQVTEQDGHDELISIIESQVKAKSPLEIKLTQTFDQFLHALKERSQEIGHV